MTEYPIKLFFEELKIKLPEQLMIRFSIERNE